MESTMSDPMMHDRPSSGSMMSDNDLLNESLGVEHLGIAAYEAALGSGLLDEPTAKVARAFQSDHARHAAVFTEQVVAHGGTPRMALGPQEYAKSYPPLTTASDIVAFAIQLEAAATRTYMRSVAAYQDRELALLAAEIGGVEAQHWAVLLGATGANPVPWPIIDVESGEMGYGMSAA
jgi:rubrerythrin